MTRFVSPFLKGVRRPDRRIFEFEPECDGVVRKERFWLGVATGNASEDALLAVDLRLLFRNHYDWNRRCR